MSAVFPLFTCIYWRHETERSNVVNSLIQLRENCVVCLSVELQQIESTLTDDVTRLVAVRNKNILCHSVQLFFSCAAPVRNAVDEWCATPSGESRYYRLGPASILLENQFRNF